MRLLVAQFILEDSLVNFECILVGLVALVCRYLLPSRPDVGNRALVEGICVALDHDGHPGARYLLAGIQFRAGVVDDLVSEDVDPVHKLPPQPMVFQLVEVVNHFLLVDRPDQSETLPQGEVGQNASLDLVGLLATDLVLATQTVLEIGVGRYLPVVFILKFKHEIPEKPHELRHESYQLS